MAHNNHQWVELSFMPVDIEIDPDNGEMSVYASPEHVDESAKDPTWCCWFCGTPANSDTVGTECSGVGGLGDQS